MSAARSRSTALRAYESLVRVWAAKVDLVSPGDLDRFWERHIADSLKGEGLLELAGPGPCADLGSGAGLPGIPLAIASPERQWRLIEPRRRRSAVLEEIVRELDLSCEVVPLTAEQAAKDPALAGAHGLVTARALARPDRAFELIRPLLSPDGLGAVWLGEHTKLPEIATEWRPGIAIIRSRGATQGEDW